MKKILTIAAALFAYTAAFSQEAPEKPRPTKVLSIGPSVGFGHTGIRNTVGTDLFKPSWSAGLIINYSTSEHVGFAADVLYSIEGALVEDADGMETDVTLQYVRVPLKFAYFFGDFEDNLRPKVTIGPSMGFLIDAESDHETDGITDVQASYEPFDLGLNASIGFNWKLAKSIWLNTDLNYYTGITEISAGQHNSNFGLKVGLAFGL
ncbi:MAG: porin family protein [Bacteroidota bacterium]